MQYNASTGAGTGFSTSPAPPLQQGARWTVRLWSRVRRLRRPRPLGDFLVTLAGGRIRDVERYGVDRAYYVGLGVSLVLAATIGSISLTIFTNIVWNPSKILLLLGGVAYFLLILGFDRWLVSDPAAGFDNRTERPATGKVGAWIGHVLLELLKVAPRVLLSVVGSLLFAEFIMLTVYGPDIQREQRIDFGAVSRTYVAQVQALGKQLSNSANSRITEATQTIAQNNANYKNGTTQIEAANTIRQKGQAALLKRGIRCYDYIRYYTDKFGVSHSYYVHACPSEWRAYDDAFAAVKKEYPETYAQLQTSNSKLRDGITADQAYISPVPVAKPNPKNKPNAKATFYANAYVDASTQLAASRPTNTDGLLAREKVLQELTSKSSAVCITGNSSGGETVQASAAGTDCVSSYSSRAAAQQGLFRWWIFLFEIAPVTIKFVRSICPRTGYAWHMAEINEKASADAHHAILIQRAELASKLRSSRHANEVELAVAATEKEIGLRSLSRERARHRLREVIMRTNRATTSPPATDVPGDRSSSVTPPGGIRDPRVDRPTYGVVVSDDESLLS